MDKSSPDQQHGPGRSLNISANGVVYLSHSLGNEKLGFSSNCKNSKTKWMQLSYTSEEIIITFGESKSNRRPMKELKFPPPSVSDLNIEQLPWQKYSLLGKGTGEQLETPGRAKEGTSTMAMNSEEQLSSSRASSEQLPTEGTSVHDHRDARTGVIQQEAEGGSMLGPILLNVFINDVEIGIGCTHIKLADDTKLSGVADILEGRGVIQRDLDRLEKWVHVNLMKFNKARCKVLHLGQDKPHYQYRLGVEGIESSPEEKDLAILVDEEPDMS
ncbi:rna-directed dna polymerase from mobile element jockey-like [Limosa lapponica baueri]|uniref:Rna-directed dna polymerase from mobile element jockey-like n=1 Tax=Limosa lapponica baueri TaxID=1758121 RepID=A0A2I0U1A9_LIMLA|nr:rna-directed dna polymerase from mobile element jockey-like [Limosa lapponica baueri]